MNIVILLDGMGFINENKINKIILSEIRKVLSEGNKNVIVNKRDNANVNYSYNGLNGKRNFLDHMRRLMWARNYQKGNKNGKPFGDPIKKSWKDVYAFSRNGAGVTTANGVDIDKVLRGLEGNEELLRDYYYDPPTTESERNISIQLKDVDHTLKNLDEKDIANAEERRMVAAWLENAFSYILNEIASDMYYKQYKKGFEKLDKIAQQNYKKTVALPILKDTCPKLMELREKAIEYRKSHGINPHITSRFANKYRVIPDSKGNISKSYQGKIFEPKDSEFTDEDFD